MPPRRSTIFVVALVALVLAGAPSRAVEGAGQRELAQGREAAARQDHAAALKHFKAAQAALDPAEEGEALADAWLQFGLTLLNGLDLLESALPAFVTSAGLARAPSTAWLWASVAAEKLGRAEEAATYKARALAPPAPVPRSAPGSGSRGTAHRARSGTHAEACGRRDAGRKPTPSSTSSERPRPSRRSRTGRKNAESGTANGRSPRPRGATGSPRRAGRAEGDGRRRPVLLW